MTDRLDPVTPPLDATARAAFDRDGYLVLESVFDENEVAAMAAEADRLLGLVLRSSAVLGAASPRLDAAMRDGRVHVRKVQPLNDLSELFAQVSNDERLIAPMRQLMSDEPILMEEKLNYKQTVLDGPDLAHIGLSSNDDSFPLHTDYGYFELEGYPVDILSSAISIDDCAGRGPLRVVPGSHRVDYPTRQPGDGVLTDTSALGPGVDIDAPPGSVMVFHSKLVHDSTPNRSGLPRRILIYSHFPARHGGDPDRRNAPLRDAGQAFERRAGVS
ncbi:MAG TPA: phytanoyl-CoA dioxygenase family protein [Ilumatobacter sp.]|nr:phytanoyl-CoA dioxygenase family protein [Ilumatobacter sp.]